MSSLPDDHVIYEVKVTVGELRELGEILDADFDVADLDDDVISKFAEVLDAHKHDLMCEVVWSALEDYD